MINHLLIIKTDPNFHQKKQKEDLKTIPTRIDEVSKSKPVAFDFVNLK
jgi:hypothetical protein